MAIPTSPISLANLQLEFGGVNPISLSEYYKGGPYVSTVSTQVPTSGVISLGDFSGVSAAANGDVTMIYTGSGGSFNPGVEDINRHFVAVCTRFSGGGLPSPGAPLINGVTMTTITSGVGNGFGDGGITGIYTIKIPTGTSSLPISIDIFTYVALYRVTGIISMTTALASGTSAGAISGSVTSSANGCFFGASVQNFAQPSYPSPSIVSLRYNTDGSNQGRMGATNATTGPTQSISLDGNQINSYATFAYDLF